VRGVWIALIAALFMLAASPSDAHRISTRNGPPPEGVSIPSLTHGQMAVIRDNLPAIRALASARLGFDLTTWRLEDYLNLQSFACLWGIVPGSITDENSPFNECAHAYLAAGRALLLQLAHEPGADHKSIDALISKIEVEMLADGASMNQQRRAVQHQRDHLAALGHGSVSSADRDDGGGRICRARRSVVARMAQAEREPATGGNKRIGLPQSAKPLVERRCERARGAPQPRRSRSPDARSRRKKRLRARGLDFGVRPFILKVSRCPVAAGRRHKPGDRLSLQ
jgi:hypothetical protein